MRIAPDMGPAVNQEHAGVIHAGQSFGKHAAGESRADNEVVEHPGQAVIESGANRCIFMAAAISSTIWFQSCAASSVSARCCHAARSSGDHARISSMAATKSSGVPAMLVAAP